MSPFTLPLVFISSFSSRFAFLLLLAVTVMAIALSLRYSAQAIMILGLIAGYLTPLILGSKQDHPWFLFRYLLLLDLAAIGLTKKKAWHVMEPISFVATVLIFGAWLLRRQTDSDGLLPATLALLAFYFLYSRISDRFLPFALQLLAALAVVPLWQGSTTVFFLVALTITAGGVRSAAAHGFQRLESASFVCFWFSYLLWTSMTTTTMISAADLRASQFHFSYSSSGKPGISNATGP